MKPLTRAFCFKSRWQTAWHGFMAFANSRAGAYHEILQKASLMRNVASFHKATEFSGQQQTNSNVNNKAPVPLTF